MLVQEPPPPLAHISLHLADYLILNGFKSLWGGQMFMTTEGGQIRLSYKREHTGINAACLAYRTAVRNKTLPWMRKQNDGVEQNTQKGNQVAELCWAENVFDTALTSSEMYYSTPSSVNPGAKAACGTEGKALFPFHPRNFQFSPHADKMRGSVGELRQCLSSQHFPGRHNVNSKCKACFCT